MISNHENELNEVLALVEKALSGNSKYQEIADHGSLEVNCYSMTLWVDFNGSNGRSSVYIKFPKIIFYDKTKSNIRFFSDKDRILSQEEFKSLKYLSQNWDKSHGINFVNPLGYVNKYNAIITERIKNEFFFKYYRKYNLLGMLNSSKYNSISEYMYKMGKSLYSFHNKRFEYSNFDYDLLKPKIGKYIERLLDYKVDINYLKNIRKHLFDIQFQCSAKLVDNLKGLDIRQIFVDDNKHKLNIIDPGKTTHGFAENDIARFIITTRILYWGSIGIFLHLRPSQIFEKKFISGYYGNNSNSNTMLRLIIVKELFKHWLMAHNSLKSKFSNKIARSFLRKFYIDRFYIHLMNEELRLL